MATHREVIGGAAQPEMEPTLVNRTMGTSSVGFHYADLGTSAAQQGDKNAIVDKNGGGVQCGGGSGKPRSTCNICGRTFINLKQHITKSHTRYNLVVLGMERFAEETTLEHGLRLRIIKGEQVMEETTVASCGEEYINEKSRSFVEFTFNLDDGCFAVQVYDDRQVCISRIKDDGDYEPVFKNLFTITFQ